MTGPGIVGTRHGIADQEISEPIRLRPVASDLAALTAEWLSEYANSRTRERYGVSVALIAAHIGANTPADLTPASIASWAESYDRANNTMRSHLNAVRMFLRWCNETGHVIDYRDTPLKRLVRSYPPTYGKVEGFHAANRLDKTGYDALLAACQDGTDAGLRDELLVRLGVTGGMRVDELLRMTVGSVRNAPALRWLGKANKPRTATAGPALIDLVSRYLDRYQEGLGERPADTAPLFCAALHSRKATQLRWGTGITTSAGLRFLLLRRATAANVGYLAPHDLKRSAARMMHEARSSDGGHLFDLLDIADVLDHTDSNVTKNCYVGPLDNSNKQRAADLFG